MTHRPTITKITRIWVFCLCFSSAWAGLYPPCSLCGNANYTITKPTATIGGSTTCLDVWNLGVEGQIAEDLCASVPAVLFNTCGCFPLGTPSPAPTDPPIGFSFGVGTPSLRPISSPEVTSPPQSATGPLPVAPPMAPPTLSPISDATHYDSNVSWKVVSEPCTGDRECLNYPEYICLGVCTPAVTQENNAAGADASNLAAAVNNGNLRRRRVKTSDSQR